MVWGRVARRSVSQRLSQRTGPSSLRHESTLSSLHTAKRRQASLRTKFRALRDLPALLSNLLGSFWRTRSSSHSQIASSSPERRSMG